MSETSQTHTEEGHMKLSDLLAPLKTVRTVNYSDSPIRTVTDDSRNVEPGTLFVAVDGEKVDGHGFISEAMDRGAAAVVCERIPVDSPQCPIIQVADSRLALSCLADGAHHHAASDLRIVGVTGTDGKTTTTELIHAILAEDDNMTGCLTTECADLGSRSVDSTQTTPHPITLHGMFREMVDAGVTHASMEVSSHSLIHQRTAHVPFDTAVLTNVTQDHLDFHGSRENYIRAKQMLFEQLDSNSVAVLNAECPVWWRYSNATDAEVLTYGIDSLADVQLLEHRGTVKGTRLHIQTPLDTFNCFSPLVGDYNCENILAAVTAAFGMGISTEAIVRTIEKFDGVGGRLEKITRPQGSDLPTVFVDYAHTPNALEKVLTTLEPLTAGRLVCVFGAGGDRDRDKRPKMGAVVSDTADTSIITADNSRSERTEDIIEDIVQGIQRGSTEYTTEPDRRRAIQHALSECGPDDVVAVCGRGSEQFQQLGDRRIPFDDRVVIGEMMQRLTGEQKRIA